MDHAREVFDGRVDILIHALANAPADALAGRFTDTSRAAFQAALDVRAYSLVTLARAAEPLMTTGAAGWSILALTGSPEPG